MALKGFRRSISAPSFQPDWSPFYFAHIATKSHRSPSFIQPDAGWIQIPLRHSREAQKVTETIIVARSLPQDEQYNHTLTLSESVIHSVMWALSVLCKPTCQCSSFSTVATDAFRLESRHAANTRIHTLVHTSLHIHNMSHILLSWTLNKAAQWQ